MKRIIAVMCAVVITLSLAACGGSPEPAPSSSAPSVSSVSSEVPASSSEPEESKISPYDEAKQGILEYVDVAYTGLTPAKAPMYFLASNDGKYVALVLENSDKKSYIKFIGSATIDEQNGVLTVTDSDKGYWFGFTAEQQADGTFFLDCGNLGKASLKADDPGTVVDSIFTAFYNMEDATDRFMDAVEKMNFMDTLDVAYTGLTALEAPMFFLASSDGEFAALVLVSSSGEEYISFVGTADIDEESGILTVTDSEKGYRFGFTAEAQADGSFFLDCGDLGECYLEPDEIENVVDYIDTVYREMDDVTDAFMDEVAG